MNKKGYTLIEILTVIVILAVISVLIIPIVGKVIEEKKIEAVFLDAKVILRELEYEAIEIEKDFEQTFLKEINISVTNLTNYDVDNSYIYIEDGDFHIVLFGKNKYEGINACGIKLNSDDRNVGKIICE